MFPKWYTFPGPCISRPLSSQWLHVPRTLHSQTSNFPRARYFQDPIFPVPGSYISRALYSLDHILPVSLSLHGLIFPKPYVPGLGAMHSQNPHSLVILTFNVLKGFRRSWLRSWAYQGSQFKTLVTIMHFHFHIDTNFKPWFNKFNEYNFSNDLQL